MSKNNSHYPVDPLYQSRRTILSRYLSPTFSLRVKDRPFPNHSFKTLCLTIPILQIHISSHSVLSKLPDVSQTSQTFVSDILYYTYLHVDLCIGPQSYTVHESRHNASNLKDLHYPKNVRSVNEFANVISRKRTSTEPLT